MMEFIPKDRQTLVCTMFSMQPAFITLFATAYFAYISKHWFWFVFIGLVLLVINCIFTLFLKESPKFLLKNNRVFEASVIFQKIAKINGKLDKYEDF